MEEEVEEVQEPQPLNQESLKPVMRQRSVLESFRYAIDGILDVFRTQRHMRIHFIMMVLVLLLALLTDLSRKDILVLLFTVSLVLMAEMFNTAIEAVVDMVVQSYHPLAKFAKDAAAGGVLIATVTAIMVGIILFIGDAGIDRIHRTPPAGSDWFIRVSVTGIVLLVAVTILKLLSSRGKLLKGGMVSGHSAFGFFLAASILFVSKNGIAALLGVLMALLIAQSRVQGKIHSVREAIGGAILAMIVTALIYWFPGVWDSLAIHMPHMGVF